MASVLGNSDERKSLHRSINRVYYKLNRDWKKGMQTERNISLVSMTPRLACFCTTIDCRIVVTSLGWLQISRFSWQECGRKYSKQKKKKKRIKYGNDLCWCYVYCELSACGLCRRFYGWYAVSLSCDEIKPKLVLLDMMAVLDLVARCGRCLLF